MGSAPLRPVFDCLDAPAEAFGPQANAKEQEGNLAAQLESLSHSKK
jgi:hypothetical protein